jgi:hypothetical protein|tara:strand:- start:4829 stop:5302 length:474 start_codon:yes stop_codon:yes gene_type:complete
MIHVAKPAEFSLSPSRYTLFAKLILVFAAGVLATLLPILLLAKIAGLLFLFIAACRFCYYFHRQNTQRLFVVDADAGHWRLMSAVTGQSSGRVVTTDLQLEPSQFVTAYLVILYFRIPQDFRTQQGTRLVVVVPRDSLSGEQHRILRKLLLSRTSCD